MTGAGILCWTRTRCVGGLIAPALLLLPGAGLAQDAKPTDLPAAQAGQALPAAPPAVAAASLKLDLATCYQIAQQRQPTINAARASLAAAVARKQGLDNLRVPSFLARDLPTRRKQASIGLVINEALVKQAENNTRYAVAYCYLSALYATEQEAVIRDAITRLETLRDFYKDFAGEKGPSTAKRDFARIESFLAVAKARIEEATQGKQRALSALREALGLGPDTAIELAHRNLFDLEASVDLKQIVALTLARRPELIQAAYGADVASLEVCAQDLRRLPTAPTFAAGSDIHSQPLPAGSYDADYKPGAVAPEMPVTLNGRRADRVEVAKIYAGRAEVVVEKVRNLVTLEAESAYYRWNEGARKLAHYRTASEHAELRTRLARASLEKNPSGRDLVDPVLTAGEQGTLIRLGINQSRYQMLIGLAGLERATACGFQAGLETASPAQDPSKEDKKDQEKEQGEKDNGKGNQNITAEDKGPGR